MKRNIFGGRRSKPEYSKEEKETDIEGIKLAFEQEESRMRQAGELCNCAEPVDIYKSGFYYGKAAYTLQFCGGCDLPISIMPIADVLISHLDK